MKRTSMLAVLVMTFMAVAGSAQTASSGQSEPTYDDKPLSEWIKQLRDKDANTRLKAIDAVAQIGVPARPSAVANLLVLLKDAKAPCRQRAIYALCVIQTEPKVLAPALARMLRDNDKGIRKYVVSYLIEMGPRAKPATAALVEVLELGDDPDSRAQAAYVLGHIKPYPDDVCDQLANAYKDGSEAVRKAAEEALKKIDPKAAQEAAINRFKPFVPKD